MNLDGELVLETECAEVAQILFRELCDAKSAAAVEVQNKLTQPALQAAAIYLARCLARRHATTATPSPNNALPVSTIVKHLRLDLFEFYRQLPLAMDLIAPKLATLCGREIDVEMVAMRMKAWRTMLVYSTLLSKKYKDLFTLLFHVDINDLMNNKVFRFGWLMFILEKSKLLPEFPDLPSCFHLLLCICNFLLVNTPNSFWHPDLRTLFELESSDQGNGIVSLHKLAMLNKIPKEEWKRLEDLMTSVEGLILDLLNSRIDVQNQEISAQGETGFQKATNNVLDPEKHLLDHCLEVLDSRYSEYLATIGECDERLFLVESVVQKLDAPIRPPTLPSPAPPPPTPPVLPMDPASSSSSRSSLAIWLTTFAQQLPISPSEKLKPYLESSGPEVGSVIQSKLFGIVQRLLPSKTANPQEISHEASLTIKIFYRALERLLEIESQMHHGKGFTSVLMSQDFVLSLLTCALEMVIASLKMEHLAFPAVLNLLQLKPFDFCKIIDLVLRAMDDLHPQLKRHLLQIEERIVESLAWLPGSSIYPLIFETISEAADTPRTGESGLLTPLFKPSAPSIPGLSLDQRSPSSAFKVVASSSRTGNTSESTQTSASVSRDTSLPEGLGTIEAVHAKPYRSRILLEDFFRKTLKLAAHRLMDFKLHLNFQPINNNTIMLQVYRTLKTALYEQTHLFYNRHLDQIMLCALYGVCKAHNLGVTFKEIVHRYKQLHQPEVYRNVILRQTNPGFRVEDMSDIIDFYNSVFVTKMQSHLLKCCNVETSEKKSGDDSNFMEKDEEPLSCERIAPWLISDTAHLSCLLKRGRQVPSLSSGTPSLPQVLEVFTGVTSSTALRSRVCQRLCIPTPAVKARRVPLEQRVTEMSLCVKEWSRLRNVHAIDKEEGALELQ